jgi:Mrp family chromosome partitioning ATPase
MSRLLAALKNLEGRGHFTPRDESTRPGSTDVPPAERESPVAAVDAVTAAAGTSHEADRFEVPSDGAQVRSNEREVPSAPSSDPSAQTPPVLDVGLIQGSSIPSTETIDDLVEDDSDDIDSQPAHSASALLDALLDEKLGTDDPVRDHSPGDRWVSDSPVANDSASATYGTETDVVEPESSGLAYGEEVPQLSSIPASVDPFVPPVEFQREELPAGETSTAEQPREPVSEPIAGDSFTPESQLPEGLFDQWKSPADAPADTAADSVADSAADSAAEMEPRENVPEETATDLEDIFGPVNYRSKEAELRMRLLADEDDESASSDPEGTYPAVAPTLSGSEPAEVSWEPPPKEEAADKVLQTAGNQQRNTFVQSTDAPAGVNRQPVDVEGIIDINDESRAAEYQAVASRLWADCRDQRRTSVLIVGIGEESHLTGLAASIAVVLARGEGARVLLVDGDIRDRRLTEALRQTATPGLASAFDRERVFDPPTVPTTTPGLEFMPAGQPRCSIRRDDVNMLAEMLRELSRRFDLVLVDGGCLPALPTEMLADACDVTYPVVRMGETNLDEATTLLDQIRRASGEISGFIAVDVPGTGRPVSDG